jgi:hypothetical protein
MHSNSETAVVLQVAPNTAVEKVNVVVSETAVVLQVAPNTAFEKVNVGVPSDPDAFIERAIAAGHPRSLDQFVDPQVASMIRENYVEKPAELAAKRVAFFKKYLRRAKELKGEEDGLRAAMPPHVLAVVGNKRLALWKEILDDFEYPDKTLIDDIAGVFKLNG